MLYISPSILSADFANLARDCSEAVRAGAEFLHIDVMDGHFVPNITVGPAVLASLKKAVPDAVYDVHLMIEDPRAYAPAFGRAGADILTFHFEANDHPEDIIAMIKALGMKVGLSIKPDTPAEAVFPYLADLDLVLIMTVEPGFGGQSFMHDQCQKIWTIHQKALDMGLDKLLIEVDGGIDKYTSQLAVTAGANVLVAGSAIFGKDDIPHAINTIRSACQGEH